ncbi:MAG: hypothetical protein KDC87_20375 [Planctomycetes bacterium]|nr:hypothetical protein [Planctomycetota bacterium]MCB9889398.1 hypothetical protein [Planctomycetota bacterium]
MALRRGIRPPPGHERAEFVRALRAELGEECPVRGLVPGTFTLVLQVHGQEVPVPLDNMYRHWASFPDQLAPLVRQLLREIEEVALERPEDHAFVDVATRILPQVCRRSWLAERAPVFGDSAIPHRELGPDLVVCYVLDDPWSAVFVCQAHLRQWGRTEADLYHLALQNLRRTSHLDAPLPDSGPVQVQHGDGYDAARVLLLAQRDPARDLLVAMPSRETLLVGGVEDRAGLEALMSADPRPRMPVSADIYRLESTAVGVRVSADGRESADPERMR